MIGIIPSKTKTFEVMGDFTSVNPKEGKLYYDQTDGRLYIYSTTQTRSNPDNGFFPIWNGKIKYISNFSVEKYVDKDVVKLDLGAMSQTINKDVANKVIYERKRADSTDLLKPTISDEDNAFTQCIKGTICAKNVTMVDLVDMCTANFNSHVIENYYQALNKISFMRLDKWYIWVDKILHINYYVEITKDGKPVIGYYYPKNRFQYTTPNMRSILMSEDDPFKKMIKMVMLKENIDKSDLKNDEVDDYTINNMMTTLNTKKALSAHLFSRFIQLSNLSYSIKIYDMNKLVFEYRE